ncbi:cyclase [Aliarcobacter trophiarum LMG 25534]|uniref:Cyclase n=1 Tax=Aliarcobacter trophiarum LMG 25534 TaxID=1032241 RepID=A0AAD0QMR6_9BACT|nr:cyclase family protein [Aliarcobacter trophiarum]AXK49280.1 cyclase [Aliarcobacter trophiarum LMG 25534]RXJ91440.1 cyclase [Aliarcobacter trophiarum LMG 25534]
MNLSKFVYLSHILDNNTPSYGNKNKFISSKKSDISKGDIANDTTIETTVHIGTHIDMPYHFFEYGQTIENFDCGYFNFENVLFIEFVPKELVIGAKLIEQLDKIKDKNIYEILIVKTGICYKRDTQEFWELNYGFDPSIAEYLRNSFPNIRVIGFDSISVSSFQNRMIGREAHKAFLNPKNPILLLEDMDLKQIDINTKFKRVIIAPLRISNCDGLPCTIIGEIE